MTPTKLEAIKALYGENLAQISVYQNTALILEIIETLTGIVGTGDDEPNPIPLEGMNTDELFEILTPALQRLKEQIG